MEDNLYSFTCYSCKAETSYDPDDYINEDKLDTLIEMVRVGDNLFDDPFKTKTVIIRCTNDGCKKENLIKIEYL